MPPQFRRQGRQEGQPAVDPVDAASAGAYLVVGVGGSVAIARSVVTVARAGVQALGDMQGRLAAPHHAASKPVPWPSRPRTVVVLLEGRRVTRKCRRASRPMQAPRLPNKLVHGGFASPGRNRCSICRPSEKSSRPLQAPAAGRSAKELLLALTVAAPELQQRDGRPCRFHFDPGCAGNPHSMQSAHPHKS
jgi:hypothetical protein